MVKGITITNVNTGILHEGLDTIQHLSVAFEYSVVCGTEFRVV